MKISKWSREKIKNRLNEIGYVEADIDYSTFTGMNQKCKFIDSQYGDWWVLPSNVVYNKSKHPKRSNCIRILNNSTGIEEIKQKIKNQFGEIVTIDESTYKSGNKKARFIDKEYGEFYQRVNVITNGLSKGHPKRGMESRKKSISVPIEEFKTRLYDIWKEEITVVEDSYIDISSKTKFNHIKYGTWEADPRNVLNGHGHPVAGRDKQRKSMMKIYGCEHPSQNRSISLKTSKSRGKRVILKHWKTNEEIICTASYEYQVIKKLNELQIDYDVQVPFPIEIDGKNRIYYVDLYLKNENKYIEIKGYFRELSRKKWEKFHSLFPNSELWLIKNVCKFTGKTQYKITKEFKNELKIQSVTNSI